jgi:hemoglobin
MKNATISEESIKQLVRTFYGKVRRDQALSPIFTAAIGGESESQWGPHLGKMVDFWSSVMLTGGRYHGNPFKAHKDLPAFDEKLFDRWLELFAQTAHELHTSDIAARYIEKSTMIAQSLRYGLYAVNAPRLRPAYTLPANATVVRVISEKDD